MPFPFVNGTQTVDTTEYDISAGANYSAGSPRTTVGQVYAFVDLSALTAGDSYQLRIYERVNGGTQLPVWESVVSGVQAQLYTFPVLLLGDGWAVTVKKLAGTNRAIKYSVRQDINSVDVATLAAGALTQISTLLAAVPAAVAGFVVETGADIVGGSMDIAGALRVLVSKAAARSSGYLTGNVAFRNMANTKNRIAGVSAPGGTGRTSTAVDPTL